MGDRDFVPQGAHLTLAKCLGQPVSWHEGALGMLCFSSDAIERPIAGLNLPCARVPMRRLDGEDTACEIWRGSASLTQGEHGSIHFRHDDSMLFGVMAVPEAPFAQAEEETPFQQSTRSAYREVFGLLNRLNFPYVYRFWNYLPRINEHSHGLERYRQFNLGRQEAFAQRQWGGVANMPAACALGTADGPLSIAFLAGRVAPQRIENPRQVSAYHYPAQYGPRSPLFSRATMVDLPGQSLLFISGTASVVGHATLHVGDVEGQTRETVANMRSVLAQANQLCQEARFTLSDLSCRIYVRHPHDLPSIRSALSHCAPELAPAVFLQAEVCREDLLLEIEASAVFSAGGRT